MKRGLREKMYHSETNTYCYVRKSKIRITESYEFIRHMHECKFNFVYLYNESSEVDCINQVEKFISMQTVCIESHMHPMLVTPLPSQNTPTQNILWVFLFQKLKQKALAGTPLF